MMRFIFGLILMSQVTASAAPRDFRQALNEMVSRSTAVDIQKSRLSASESVLLSRRFSFLPSLSLNATQSETGDPKVTEKSLVGTAKLNLFRFGGDWAALKAAEAGRDYEKAQLEQTDLQAEADAVNALVELLQTRMTSEIIKNRVTAAEEVTSIASIRFKRGLTPAEEVSRVEIDLSNERAQLDNATSSLNVAEAGVARLLGNSEVSGEWPWKQTMRGTRIRELLDRKPSLEERPDYRAANLLVESQDQRSKQSYRGMLPSLDLSYSRGEYEVAGTWQPGWSALVTLSIPLFNGLQDYSEYRTQAERAREAELKLEQLKRDELNLQKSYQENFRLALQTAEAREKTLATAQRLLKVNVTRYKAGRADANDLAIERSRESQAELLAIEGWARAHQALVKLAHSFGKSVREL